MNKTNEGDQRAGDRELLTVNIPGEVARRLMAFCKELNVPPDLVVTRALLDYFREGDMSH